MLIALLTARSPARGNSHPHEAHSHAALMAKTRSGGSDQPLHGLNLIGKAALNVLEPRGKCEITGVEEERLHLCHEHISVAEQVAHLR
jgi:hypothetical protein